MLSSFQDYNSQFLGVQQYPYVASTGTIALYGSSPGAEVAGFRNVHLPKVKQQGNVALIMYDATEVMTLAGLLSQFGVTDYGVSMNFPMDLFNQTSTVMNWVLGKEIGADGVVDCDKDQQVYALFVGSSDEYLSFDNFEMIVEESRFFMANGSSILVIDDFTVSISDE